MITQADVLKVLEDQTKTIKDQSETIERLTKALIQYMTMEEIENMYCINAEIAEE